MSQNYPGYPQPQYRSAAPVKSMVLSYVLWFFLGGIGVHKFYLRQTWQGAAYAVASITGTLIFSGEGIGYVFLIPLWVGLVADIFLIPAQVNKINMDQI